MTDQRTFVIVGASLTGAKAAETLREAGFDGQVVLVGAETERPYERPPLSKDHLHGKDARGSAYVHDAAWYAEHGVDLRLGTTATHLDPGAHEVTLDGGERLHYDKLLLATGSRARRLNIPGGDLEGVRYLRTLAEADALAEALGRGGRVVVVGAGWIGLETAAAARHHGADVTVVEMDSAPLRRVLGDEVAEVYPAVHRAHGVNFKFNASVREFRGEAGRLTSVVLDDGTELAADLAIVGVGIEPVVDLADAAGLHVDNGIVTDEGLRTSDADIFAAGDVANAHNPMLGRRVRVEHWANALNGGKAVARSMLGEEVVYDRVPYFYTDQYHEAPAIGMEYCGWAGPGDYNSVVLRGSADVESGRSPEFVVFWLDDGRVLAAMNVNVWDVQEDLQRLVRAGHAGSAVDPSRLADPSVPLADLLP